MAQQVAETPNPAEAVELQAPRKKPKKPKLSKEEKKRRRELAALELKQRLIREQLLREIELCKKSVKRGKPLWEGLCAEVKIKEFREEIQEWAKKAESIMTKKDEKAEMLLKTIKETQEMSEKNFSQHLEKLDYLTKCHQTFRQTATALYETEAADMLEDFYLDLARSTENTERLKLNIESVMHSTNVVTKDKLKQNYQKYMSTRFNEVCKMIELRYMVRNRTAEKMRRLQDQLLHWMKVLQGDMVDVHKTSKFLYFMERQRNYVTESTKLNNLEKASRKAIIDLQNEILAIELGSSRKIHGLKLEQSYFMQVRSIIKQSIERDKQLTYEKLIVVSSESYRVLNKLKEHVRFGELLLGLAACCRKHQTEREKVIPWTTDTEANDSTEFKLNNLTFDLAKLTDVTEEELAQHMEFMKNFWLRCSNVRLHTLMLMEEKRRLNEENEKYRDIIRSMKKSDDVEYILQSLDIKPLKTSFSETSLEEIK